MTAGGSGRRTSWAPPSHAATEARSKRASGRDESPGGTDGREESATPARPGCLRLTGLTRRRARKVGPTWKGPA